MTKDTFDADLANDYDSPIRHPEATPGGGRRWPLLISAQPHGYRPLTIDLRVPAGPGPHPVVVYIHGGAWLFGHPHIMTRTLQDMAIADTLLGAGYAFAAITYRMSAEAQFPVQLHDCKAAVRYLRKHAAALSIDPTRIASMGESAGGHLAALLGMTGHLPAMEGEVGVIGPSSAVQAVVNWYGPAEFLTMNAQRPAFARQVDDDPACPEALLIGALMSKKPKRARAASPITYVSAQSAPMLIQHGDQDRLVPIEQSRALAKALKASGAVVKLVEVKGADHCFWHGDTAPIMPEIIRFLNKHLKR